MHRSVGVVGIAMKSRIARMPVKIPAGVQVEIGEGVVLVKGAKGQVSQPLHSAIRLKIEEGHLHVSANMDAPGDPNALAGTTRALLQNHVVGVTTGFMRKLLLVGVGYRAQVKKGPHGGDRLELTLGLHWRQKVFLPSKNWLKPERVSPCYHASSPSTAAPGMQAYLKSRTTTHPEKSF